MMRYTQFIHRRCGTLHIWECHPVPEKVLLHRRMIRFYHAYAGDGIPWDQR
jgi:hypothetical protein